MTDSYSVSIVDDEECSWSERNILRISYRGKTLEEFYDYGEPEDNSFYRDWNWIQEELIRAYELGRADGRKEIESLG